MKKAFTLVELLAVIVILAVILVIAVPTITNVIESSRLSSIESSARLILDSANTEYLKQSMLEESTDISCSELSDNTDQYSFCEITFYDGKASIGLKGSDDGKFSGYYCEGDKDTLTCKKKSSDKVLLTFKINNYGNSQLRQAKITKRFYEANAGDEVSLETCTYINELQDTCSVKINNVEITKATLDFYEHVNGTNWFVDEEAFNYYTVSDDTEFSIEYNGCVVEGTRITMGDGTFKNVEDLKEGDIVMTYDFFEGKMSPKKLTTIETGSLHNATILTVTLDNGDYVKIVSEESMFDMDSRKYIVVSKDTIDECIGKNVMVYNNGSYDTAKIISITSELKDTKYYTLYTSRSINYIGNNILLKYSLWFNNDLFTIDENYKVDYDILNEDINKYGLYTYDDLKDFATEEDIYDYNLIYFKFIESKYNYTREEVLSILKIFISEMNNNK